MLNLSLSVLWHLRITFWQYDLEVTLCLFFSVEDMIKEVDVDGDGRIDFYGKKRQL
jgi:hypothetical protein